MKVDNVVTLSDGKKYLLLLESVFMGVNYFLALLLNYAGEFTDEYVVLKKIIKDGEVYAQKVKNPIILSQLLEDYRIQYEDEYEI